MSADGFSIEQALDADWEGDEVVVEVEQPEAELAEDDEEIQDADPTADEEDEDLEEIEGTESDEDEESEGDESEDELEETPGIVLEPPKFWGDDEAKAEWVKLPREIQEQVIARENDRNSATDRILSSAGEERKKAVEATQALGQLAQRANEALQQIEQAMSVNQYDSWTPQDWINLKHQNRELYEQHKDYADVLAHQRQEALKVKQQADLANQGALVEHRTNLLKQHKPEVLEAQSEITEFLSKTYGYTPDQVQFGSAADWDMAYKAMKHDQATAQAKAKASKSKPSKPAPRGVRASAGQTSTSRQRKKASAKKKFAANPSIANALDLMPDF